MSLHNKLRYFKKNIIIYLRYYYLMGQGHQETSNGHKEALLSLLGKVSTSCIRKDVYEELEKRIACTFVIFITLSIELCYI